MNFYKADGKEKIQARQEDISGGTDMKTDRMQQLLLKDKPLMEIYPTGECVILDFDRLPFALRREDVSFVDFMEWASNRTLSMGRSYAKEILNAMRLSQTNRYAVCRACRGLSLEDSYWIRQDGDEAAWDEVNLFHNPLSLFITEVSLSGRSVVYRETAEQRKRIHTPELTTFGTSAKGWIRQEDGLYLHKIGKYEIPAHEVLEALRIPHIPYEVSSREEISSYLSPERQEWIEGVGEAVVKSKLFTTEDTGMVTFEEFALFCDAYGLNAFEEAAGIDRELYLQMQLADYLLNNNDRHEQNWGFYMDNGTGKITGFCPLFDHDHAFSDYPDLYSQTTASEMTLFQAAVQAQRELRMDLGCLEEMRRPAFLTGKQWEVLLERKRKLENQLQTAACRGMD